MVGAMDLRSSFYYERKYLTEGLLPYQLETLILTHPALFRPIFYPRQVFSIYFDTPEFDYYQQNMLDNQQRKKIRVRWYKHQQVISPLQVEIKLRNGEVLKKITHPLSQSVTQISLKKITQLLCHQLQSSVAEVFSLRPVLVSSYLRKYFIADSLNVRITLDSNLCFQTIDDWQKGKITYQLSPTILECKYTVADDWRFEEIVKNLPLRLTKASKYVMGIQQCYLYLIN